MILKIYIAVLSFVLTFMGVTSALGAQKPAAPEKLQFSVEFILQKVIERKQQKYEAQIPTPKIFLESETSLKQFQDAIEPQWGFRPDQFTNAYVVAKNEIYLMDEASYYHKVKRCMDDSLAHEFTHFVQSKYQKFDLNDESLEWEAVDVQTWFRENFCKIP